MQFPKMMMCLFMGMCPLAFGQSTGETWDGEAELGALITSGNSEETNINSRLGLVHETTSWRNLLELRSLYSEADDETTSERYSASAETNYKFSERQYWFLRGAYDDNRFTGYDFRTSATTGYGHRVWQNGERSFLDLSVGAGYRFNKLKQPNEAGRRSEQEAIARLAGQYDYALSDNALFRQKLSTEVGLDGNNTISESETSVQASVVGNVSMKAAYLVKHVSNPPAGAERIDTEMSLSLLYGF
ncbi:DUF481 domain-containing protein [Marinobacter caseinilyticus]|uniref:DUF481 domain-containing protein n=1 Tax=Marinobacter caseinilyticus TaxID=2692195 RepID=UPI00140889CC|nr:DUF481 domain-containing protein [Marinobacter caseinilyticus]